MSADRRLNSVLRILESKKPINEKDISILDLPKDLKIKIIKKLNSSLPQQSLNMKNSQNKVATIKRMLQLNQQQQSSSSPDVELIQKMQERTLDTTHPMFRLSIEDYENMCKNEKKLPIMARLFDTTISKLKKICKKIHIFKEYIDSSPETIKNKMKITTISIRDLPKDTQIKITEILGSLLPKNYVLRNWVLNNRRFQINSKYLSQNPNAIDYLKENPELIDWGYLSTNPNAIKLLENKFKEENNLTERELQNLTPKNKINWLYLSENPKAKKLLEAKYEKEKLLNQYELESNRMGRYPFSYLNWSYLSANPCTIDLLRKNINKIYWGQLSANPNSKAIELLNLPENINRMVWRGMTSNKSKSPIKLPKNQNDIDWGRFSWLANTEEHMELLRKRAEYEDTLSNTTYLIIERSKKIDWFNLLRNPAIFI